MHHTGAAQSGMLPIGDFSFLEEEDISSLYHDWKSWTGEEDYGYICSVDLTYPEELHENHDAFPLAPEKMEVTYNDLSPTSRQLLEKSGIKSHKQIKLLSHLGPQKDYVVYYTTLKTYLKLGLKLDKINKVLQFKQKKLG